MNNLRNIIWAEIGVIILSSLLYLQLYQKIDLYMFSIPFLTYIKILGKFEAW